MRILIMKPIRFALALLGCFAAMAPARAAITNVTAVNVTPASFSLLWRAPADTVPSVAIFADSAGQTNLAGKVGVEAFPLHTGNPDQAPGYERRLGRAVLRSKTAANNQMLFRITGVRPNTTYYYRVTSTPNTGSPDVFPNSGALPSVTTPKENTFVANYQQLIVGVTDLNPEGRVALLTHPNAAYPLASVVGDGVGTNQVAFDANNLFAAAGGGNFSALGQQDFIVNILGAGETSISQQFTLNFTANFTVAQSVLASLGTEFFAAAFGSTILLVGQDGAVTINGNSSVGLSSINVTLDIPTGHLTNLTLQGLSPELSAAASSVIAQAGNSVVVHLAALAGQGFTGNKPLGQLAFRARTDSKSAFVPLRVTAVTATKIDALPVSQIASTSGRVVVIGAEPLVEAFQGDNGVRNLTLYGRPNASYAIEAGDVIGDTNAWSLWTRVPLTGMTTNLIARASEGSVFYRAYEFQADPPMLEARMAADGTRTLLLYGKPGGNYSLEYKSHVGPGAWQPWTSVPMPNSFATVPAASAGPPNVFFRAY